VLPSLVFGQQIEEWSVSLSRWLWEPYLAFGALSVLDGDPGVGKSLLTVDLAARIGTRRDFPDGTPVPHNPETGAPLLPTLFVNAEDAVRQTIVPRLLAASGSTKSVMFLGGIGVAGARSARFPDDLPLLGQVLRDLPGAFVVLDPMMALFPKGVAAGNDQAVREVLTPLARLAAETSSCLLLVRHLNPRQSRRALYRGAGSIGILGACRTGRIIERHPDDPERRVLATTKTNLGPQGPSLGFRIKTQPGQEFHYQCAAGETHPETGEVLKEPATGVVHCPAGPVLAWEGVSSLTADDLCLSKPHATGPGLRAAAWLKKLLADGPVAATEIEKLADKEGFGYRTVCVAKARLKFESQRVNVDGQTRWEWMLPPDV
jgi:hypothetical protein